MAEISANGAKMCVYCETGDISLFKGREHVIPEAFGTFGSQTPTLDCVCDACNAFFGRVLDQPLARETLEGITRYARGRFSSERRPQKRLRITIADDAPVGAFAGAVVEGVDPTTNALLPLRPQLHVLNRVTGDFDVFLREDVGSFSLAEEVYGEPGKREARMYAMSQGESEEFVRALSEAGVHITVGASIDPPDWQPDEDGQITIPVFVEGVVDDVHKRALTKVLVNFVAYYLGPDIIRDAAWKFARRYARFGEGLMPAKISQGPFWSGMERTTLRYSNDSINVRIENQEKGVVGVIEFYNRVTYQLLLIADLHVASDMEIACRFTPGTAPILGARGASQEEVMRRVASRRVGAR